MVCSLTGSGLNWWSRKSQNSEPTLTPNEPTAPTILEDTPILKHEVFLVRLPIEISLVNTTNATSCPGTDGAHPCVLLEHSESDVGDSIHSLQVLVMQSFRTGEVSRPPVETSALSHLFLPLPFHSRRMPSPTPAGFGHPLVSPKFRPRVETWVLAKSLSFEVTATTRVRHFYVLLRLFIGLPFSLTSCQSRFKNLFPGPPCQRARWEGSSSIPGI